MKEIVGVTSSEGLHAWSLLLALFTDHANKMQSRRQTSSPVAATLANSIKQRCLTLHATGAAAWRPILTKFSVHVAKARSSSDGNAICYVLPVLWMTSFFIMERMGQNQRRRICFEFSKWRPRGAKLSYYGYCRLIAVFEGV